MNDIEEQRHYFVTKSNEFYRPQLPNTLIGLIQKCGAELTLAELKFVGFLISKVKPGDKELQEYPFSVREFCEVCGMAYKSGKNYERIQKMIKQLADKSEWVKDEAGRKILFRWIETPIFDQLNSKILVRLNPLLTKYLLQLHGRYFQYEFIFTLPLKSAYSYRLYELARSYSDKGEFEWPIEELRKFLCVPEGYDYKEFNRKAIKRPVEEINKYTDLRLTVEPIREQRRVVRLKITVEKLDYFERDKNYQRTKKELDGTEQIPGQMELNDYLQKGETK